MRPGTVFRIASITKPVTAAVVLSLVEDGLLGLDEPVDRLLPELSHRKVLKRLDGPVDDTVAADRPITVRDLLAFTMGFGIVMAPPGQYPIQKAMDELSLGQGPPHPASMPAADEWIRRLGPLPLLYQPGERWMYNTGSDVLGVLIARASGQPLQEFLRERVFEPLGMRDTAFSVPSNKIDRLATGYGTEYGTGARQLYDPAEGGEWSRPPAFPSGGAGLVSTVDDYHAFARMLLNRGRQGNARVLSRFSVEAMTTDQLTPQQKSVSGLLPGYFDSHGWGFGVSIVTRRVDVAAGPGRYGWDGGLGTSWFTDPNEELIAILMTQQAWSSPGPPEVCLDFWTSAYVAMED